jgi:hypothetical protein
VIGVAAAGVMALGAQTALAGGEPVDSTPPDLQLSGKKNQELGKAVKVKASCGDEACTARARGQLSWRRDADLPRCPVQPRPIVHDQCRLKPASADLGPGETTTLKLKLTKKKRRSAGNALDNGKKVLAKVTVDATDAAGNVATAKRTIKLVE